jgi:hypothetical protein
MYLPQPFATVHDRPILQSDQPSVFAIVRRGHLCKQGVVGSSPIVSTV